MKDKMELVDYKESLSIKVGKFLLSKGFNLASCTGMAEHILADTDSLGILYKDSETRPRKSLFDFILRSGPESRRRMFIGTVWFISSVRGANEQNWVFEAYGRKYVDSVRQLAEEMASTFNVKITVHLVREQPDFETYLSDYEH